jgi:hypothetical protein
MMGAAVLMIGMLLGGGAFYAQQAFAATPTLTVQTTSSSISSLGSAQIQVQIQNGAASTSYSVTVEVAGPTAAGGPFCDTLTVTTDGSGNGQATVSFPDTGVASAEFTAAACVTAKIVTAAGTGGPSTELAGTYTVTVSSSPAITGGTPSTTFAVTAPQGVVAGSMLSSGSLTSVYSPILVSGGYLVCSGQAEVISSGPIPASTSTLPSGYPTDKSQIGSNSLTGVITSVTPGQGNGESIYNPCYSSAAPTWAITLTTYTFSNVVINLPSGGTVSGGLIMTVVNEAQVSYITGTSGSTISIAYNTYTFTGTGGLAGMSGIAGAIATTVTVAGGQANQNPVWVQLSGVGTTSSSSSTTGSTTTVRGIPEFLGTFSGSLALVLLLPVMLVIARLRVRRA